MRIAVVGAGAIGATFAAALERAGHELVLCARTPVGQITVERDGEPPQALSSPIAITPEGGRANWVLLAVKAHQTAGAAPWLAALARPCSTPSRGASSSGTRATASCADSPSGTASRRP